jgi:lysophospholipase L1-like esterase
MRDFYFKFARIVLSAIVSMTSIPMIAQNTSSARPLSYLALGDSYTIGESVKEGERWPNQLQQIFHSRGVEVARPYIIATTGWRTDDLKNAINKAKPSHDFDLVSLLIGVNNQYQGKSAEQYAVEFEDLLKTAIELAQGRKENVFVVSIPDYGFTPFGKSKQTVISRELDLFNSINKRITEQYKVTYIDITGISRKGLDQPELVATDGLHPSGKMYALWVDLILTTRFPKSKVQGPKLDNTEP